jgi:hypothetical protein
MEADAYFAMGKSHTVCQDYAGVRGTEVGVRVAVSDGCSSSPDTDFGSRFLVKATLSHLSFTPPGFPLIVSPHLVSALANEGAEAVGLPTSCLDATLLLAEAHGDDLDVVVYGDGVIDIEFKNGDRSTYSIEFEREAPAYPSYFLRPDDMALYLEKYGRRTVTVNVTPTDRAPFTNVVEGRATREDYGFKQRFPWDTVRRVTLCSDGVRSFRKVVSPGVFQSVPLADVLAQVTSIHSTAGQFMVRRMRRFLYDFCPKNGWFHEDDVGVATILNTDK